MEFSDKLKYARERLLISQELLARELEISFATINRLENKRTEPSLPTQRKFMEFCERKGIGFPDEVK